MNGDDPSYVNPYQSPRPVDALPGEPGELVAEMVAVEMPSGKADWRLLLYADRLRFTAADGGPPQDVARAQLSEKVTLHDFLFMRRSLEVKLGRKKKFFQLGPEDFAAFTEWIGPPTAADLKKKLKRRLTWILPIGIVFVLGSLPVPGDPAAGIEAIPFDPIAFVLEPLWAESSFVWVDFFRPRFGVLRG